MKRIIFLLAAVFGCLQICDAAAADLPDGAGVLDIAANDVDGSDNQPTPRDVTCDAKFILPTDVFTITVKKACPGVTYFLHKYNTEEPITSSMGFGADLMFTGAWGAGWFEVFDDTGQKMNNQVSASIYWPLIYNFTKAVMYPISPVPVDGGIVKLDLYAPYGPTIDGMIELFDRYNAGDSPTWDNGTMRIYAESREIIDDGMNYIFHIKIYSAPNLSSNTIYNTTGINNYGSLPCHSIYQYSGGKLIDWDIHYESDPIKGNCICLTNTQYLVKYELYNNGELVAAQIQEPNKDLCFERLLPGLYTVKATHQGVSKEHEGVFKVQLDKYLQQKPLITYDGGSSIALNEAGGTMLLSCQRDTVVDNATLEQAIRNFNSENQVVRMRLADSSETECNIELTYEPNFSDKDLAIDSKFIFSGNSHVRFMQAGSGDIIVYDVISGMEPRPFIRLSGSQVGVRYEVRTNGASTGIVVDGTGNAIEFNNVPTGAIYKVRGTKPGLSVQGKPVMHDMRGVAILIENPENQLTGSTNAISTKTYYDWAHSYTDITYYDGLGAPYQTVQNRAAPDGRNLVTPILYDNMYRDNATVLLPFPVDMYTGERVEEPERDQAQYYAQRSEGERTTAAYSTNVFDRSGLDRIRYSYRPGDVYRQDDKFTEYLYETNVAADNILDFEYNYNDGSLTVSGYAPVGTLVKNTVIDEDGKRSARFTDANGNTVLDRRYFSKSYFTDTYYVYDPCFNRLVWVISPEGRANIVTGTVLDWNHNTANKYCYRYRYDGRGNMVERKLPGCEKESFVYDKGDRLVFSRDGNLHSRKQWLYHVYDNHGHLLRQNMLDYDISRAELQARYDTLVDNLLPTLGGTADMDIPHTPDGKASLSRNMASYVYGNVAYAKTEAGFVETPWSIPGDMTYRGVGFPGTPLQNPRDLKTYEKLAVLGDDADTSRYVERTYFYDYKKRLMQVVERNPEGGVSRTSYDYDYLGNVVRYKELRQPYAGADEDMVTAEYTYDNRRRLIREISALGLSNSVTTNYDYDDLGQLVGKTTRGGRLGTTLAYNLQGWQTDMQVVNDADTLFGTRLRYYDPQQSDTAPSYTGNI